MSNSEYVIAFGPYLYSYFINCSFRPNIIRGLQGTYVLPGSFDDSTIREEGEDNASDRDILYPQAPLLAKKIRPSETFRNTELLEDADV